MSDDKKQAQISVEILNKIANEEIFSIREMMGWKTLICKNSPISEGFKKWKEIRIFLSGYRAARIYSC